MAEIIKFGESAEGYNVPVLNEREVRAAAGILFLATFTSLFYILFRDNFAPIKYVVTIFFIDFLIRVFINPKFSPSLIISRLIVRNQTPEYVGAAPKKFAWTIGLVLSGIMFYFFVIINAYSPVTGIICLVCLLFLFFESAFGICLGCLFYPLFFRKKAHYCPGGICDVKEKHDIQKTSAAQLLVISAFIVIIFLTFHLMNGRFNEKPYAMSGTDTAEQTR